MWGINLEYFFNYDEIERIHKICNLIREENFSGVLLCPPEEKLCKNLREIKSAIRNSGLTIYQLHPPWENIAEYNEKKRAEAIDFYKRWIEYALLVEAQTIIVHPGKGINPITSDRRKKNIEKNIESINSLVEELKGSKLKIALENMLKDDYGHFSRIGSLPSDLVKIIKNTDKGYVGICVDTGHFWTNLQDITKCIEKLAPYIITTHIHDNVKKGDAHFLPGSGSINWPAVMKSFCLAGYKGPFVYEVGTPKENKIELLRKSKNFLFCCYVATEIKINGFGEN